jgi:hypothetical protein
MFLTLLPATLAVAAITCWIVTRLFSKSLDKILNRIIQDEIASGWKRYLQFAIFVVGIGSGVNLYKLERYAEGYSPSGREAEDFIAPVLNGEAWVLEIYRVVIGTLEGIAWALLLFFLASMIAFVIVKKREAKQA